MKPVDDLRSCKQGDVILLNLQDDDFPTIKVEILEKQKHAIRIEASQISAWDGNHVPVEFDPLFSATIKWDGCCNVESHGFHLCGGRQQKQVAMLFARLAEWVLIIEEKGLDL